MAKRRKRKRNQFRLTALEQAIAVLDQHRYENEELEERRQSIVRAFITQEALTPPQQHMAFRLAKPIQSKAKKVRTVRKRQTHYVYAIDDGHYVKIGYSLDPEKRLADLQVACPSELRLSAKIECQRQSQAKRLEKQIHRACRQHHIRGEWFGPEALRVFDSHVII